jgi:hypothetical protein
MNNFENPSRQKRLSQEKIDELIKRYKLGYDKAHLIVTKKDGGKIYFPTTEKGDVMNKNGDIVERIDIEEAIKMALDKEGTEYDKE